MTTSKLELKKIFLAQLQDFVDSLKNELTTQDGQWTIKGLIDVFQNVYALSADTKIVSKILEIHLFPKILTFAQQHNYAVVVADHQNYYPDFSFVNKTNPDLKFAVDIKTSYRLPNYPNFCNGFTLGSHGEYFTNRSSTRNIQFPYQAYLGHYCLGIIYSRIDTAPTADTEMYTLADLNAIASVIGEFQFFAAEKWRIASDKSGSGNTANIGSISHIPDLIQGNGVFRQLGEAWFDDYWMNYGQITIQTETGRPKKITNLVDFVNYRGGNVERIVPKARKRKRKK